MIPGSNSSSPAHVFVYKNTLTQIYFYVHTLILYTHNVFHACVCVLLAPPSVLDECSMALVLGCHEYNGRLW